MVIWLTPPSTVHVVYECPQSVHCRCDRRTIPRNSKRSCFSGHLTIFHATETIFNSKTNRVIQICKMIRTVIKCGLGSVIKTSELTRCFGIPLKTAGRSCKIKQTLYSPLSSILNIIIFNI